MTNAEQIEKITNAAQCFALLEILKFSAAERLKRRFEPQKQAAELLKF